PEDYVSTEDGTGVVHQAPAFGEIDYDSCKKHGMHFIQPVKVDGTFTDEVSDFKCLFVKDADPRIIEWLDSHDLLFKTEKYTHSYPFCWRCKTPLIYYAMVSWFIAVTKIRNRLVELNQKIEWYPDHIKDGRFGKWLEGAKDWALSRTKFWGTPLPVWKCACGKIEVIGSIEELNKKTQNSKLKTQQLDLHKPFVDDIKIKCECSKEMSRIPDVIDCWYDSGAAPFAQYHYPFENKDLFDKSLPYDFIAEAIDQTRGWFYTLLVLSTILFDKLAYKRCAVGGLLCDEKGDKMSKSRGNILQPTELFDKVGVDAIRILMCSYPFGENIRFGFGPMKETVQPFMTILWNSFYYATDYLEQHSFKKLGSAGTLSIEDRWIISRMNTLIDTVQTSLDTGKFNNAVSAIQNFVN
ncbi:MAG: class I tRNA ligase family protein, partial [Nanoarchaeota archaeon]